MLNEFLESFRARFVVSSIIRMKFFFSSTLFSQLHNFQMAKFGIYNYISVIAVCHYLFFIFFLLIWWYRDRTRIVFSVLPIKKSQFYMKWSSTRFPGPSYQFLLSPFILLTYRIVHHSGSWPRSPTNYLNEKQFNNFVEWRQQTMNYLSESTKNAETKQTVTNKFQSKTWFFFLSKSLKWKESNWTYFFFQILGLEEKKQHSIWSA